MNTISNLPRQRQWISLLLIIYFVMPLTAVYAAVSIPEQNKAAPMPRNNTTLHNNPITPTQTLLPDFSLTGEDCPECLGADIRLEKSDGTTLSPKGSVIAYNLTYYNDGVDEATGVVITETVPQYSTFAANLSTPGWQQIGSTNIYNYHVGTIAKYANDSIIFAVTMDTTLPTGVETITNTAFIGDDGVHGPDKTPLNNSSTDVNFIVNEPTNVCGTITEDTTWTPFGSPYIVSCEVVIPANVTLTLNPGTVVKFNSGLGIDVYGTLSAQATAVTEIIFTANRGNPTRGSWDGIDIFNGGQAIIKHAQIEYGGNTAGPYDAMIFVLGGGSLQISDSQLENSGHYASQIDYNNGSIARYERVSAINNNQQAAFVSGNLSTNSLWDIAGDFAFRTNGFTIGTNGRLTVAPGNTLKFTDGNDSLIVNGTLDAIGTAIQPVAFTSIHDDAYGGDTNNNGGASGPFKASWDRIQINNGATVNINHGVVRYGGENSSCCFYGLFNVSAGGTLIARNSTISHSEYRGISSGGGNLTLENNTFHSNNNEGVLMVLDQYAFPPTFVNNTVRNNGGYGVIIISNSAPSWGQIEGNQGWSNPVNGIIIQGSLTGQTYLNTNNNFPYVFNGDITLTSSATLELEPGVVVKFHDGDDELFVDGTLLAVGTLNNPINFTALSDDSVAGDTNNNGGSGGFRAAWDRILIRNGGTAVFDHTNIRYGGENSSCCFFPILQIERGGTLTMTNANVTHSEFIGVLSNHGNIYIEESNISSNSSRGLIVRIDNNMAPPRILNNTFNSNGWYAVQMRYDNGSTGEFHNNSGSGNVFNGIETFGTVVGDARWQTNNNFPYIIHDFNGQFTVAAGSSLTVDPGVIVKLNDGNDSLHVNGLLDARGTAVSPIFFTALADDSVGGDTNNNGNSGGFRAAWDRILINSGGTALFDNATILWGGENSSCCFFPMVQIADGGTITMTNSTVRFSEYYGMRSDGGQVTLENSNISNHSSRGAHFHMNATTPFIRIVDNTFNSNWHAASVRYSGQDRVFLTGNSATGNTYNSVQVFGTIGGNTRWQINNQMPYLIDEDLLIEATGHLTVDPDVVVKFFDGNDELLVDGFLDAEGTVAQPIVFTAFTDDAFGGDTNNNGNSGGFRAAWDRIYIRDGGQAKMDNNIIRWGGENSSCCFFPIIQIATGGTLTMTNSSLRYSEYYGLRSDGGRVVLENNDISDHSSRGAHLILNGSTPLVRVVNNTFNRNWHAASIAYGSQDRVVFTNNSATSNTYNSVQLFGPIGGNTTWSTNIDMPYLIDQDLLVEANSHLTIAPDVIVKLFDTNDEIFIDGTVDARGTAAKPIVFTALADDNYGGDTNNNGPSNGFRAAWDRILVRNGGTAEFDHAIIRWGGENSSCCFFPLLQVVGGGTLTVTNSHLSLSEYNGIASNNGNITVRDSVIHNNSNRGIHLDLNANAPTPHIINNTFTSHGWFPISLRYNAPATTEIRDNSGSSNAVNGIEMIGIISDDEHWYVNPGLPNVIVNTLRVTDSLTIDPGVVNKFWDGDDQLFIEGTLTADGTAVNPIIFTALADDAYGGDTNNNGPSGGFKAAWDRILVQSSGSALFDNTVIRWGGENSTCCRYPLVQLDNGGTLTLTNSTLSHSEDFGLKVASDDHLIERNRFFSNNNRALENTNQANITVRAQNNWWGHPTGPFPVGSGQAVSAGVLFDPWLGLVADFDATPITSTVPFTVTFTDQSLGTPTAWLWDFGDGLTSTLQSPVHTYTVAGLYTVTLTVSNGTYTDTFTIAALINANPVSFAQGEPFTIVAQPHKARLLGKFATQIITQTLPPPLPSSFYGTVTVEGDNIPAGTLVTAWINGIPFAETAVFLEGTQSVYQFDFPGDITDTTVIEGGLQGETIRFRLGGALGNETAVWQFGTFVNLDLSTFYGNDLVISHADVPTTVQPRDPITYTLTITNDSPDPANGTLIRSQLPADLTILSASDGGTHTGNLVTWPTITLGAGQTVNRTVVVQLNPTFAAGIDAIINSATVTYDGNNGLDPTPANNSATASSILDAVPDLQISKQSAPTVTPGNTFVYTLTVTNVGVQGATGVVISDVLPQVRFLNASDSGVEQDGTVTWFPFELAAGATAVRTITAQLPDLNTFPNTQTTITNTATVVEDGANGPEPNLANNEVVLLTAVTTQPDLTIPTIDLNQAPTDPQNLIISGTATVQLLNAGNLNLTDPFTVTLFEDSDGDALYTAGIDNTLGETVAASTIGISQTIDLNVPVNGTVAFRDNIIHAFADSTQLITELNETNNIYNTAAACTYSPAIGNFNPVVERSWPEGGVVESRSNQTMSTPLIINLTDDNNDGLINDEDVPDILFTTADLSGASFNPAPNMLRAIDGQTGQAILNIPQFYLFNITSIFLFSLSGMAAGDIDNDGVAEIIVSSIVVNIHPFAFGASNRLLAYDHTGNRKWISPEYSTHPTGSPTNRDNPTIADIDGDGTPEIVVGGVVFNNNGSIRWRGTAGQAYQSARNADRSDSGAISVVANLDMIGDQEVIAGNTAYRADGSIYWQAPYDDGYPAVGNFDEDDNPEIVVVARGSIRLQNHDGSLIWGPHDLPGTDPNAGGAPTVADFDGDGAPEIGVATSDRYVVYETDGSLKWQSNTQDNSSNMTGSTVFDFEGDGNFEVVYRDERRLRIYNGSNGTILSEMVLSSETQNEEVVVADVDKDGNAEIIVTSDRARQVPGIPNNERTFGLRVIGDANDNWVATRSLWNQHAYHVDNVNDDGTIPTNPAYSWLTHNTFRANIAPQGIDIFAAPDFTVSQIEVDFNSFPNALITARIGNGGSTFAASGTPIAFYDGDPNADGTLIGTTPLPVDLQPGESTEVSLNWLRSGFNVGSIYVVADDDGTGQGRHGECREENNSHNIGYDTAVLGLVLTIADGETQVTSGETLTYTLNILNAFNGPATGVVLTNTLPTYTTFITASDTFSQAGDTLIWSPLTIDAGATATRTLTVRVADTLPITATAITNTATVADDGANGADQTPFNNTAVDVNTLSTVRADAGGPYNGNEGQPILLDGTGSLDRDGVIILYEWDLDNDGDFDDAFSPTTTVTLPDNGDFTVNLRVRDNDGETDTDSAIVQTANLSPTVTATITPTFDEGTSTKVTLATFTDPGSDDTHTATIDWGDGTVVSNSTPFGLVEGTHTYVDSGTYPVEVCVTDDDGGTNCSQQTAVVNNLAPVVEAGPDTAALAGETVTLTPSTFTDAGVNDTHIATVDWGDSTVVTTTVSESNGSGTVNASHAYATTSVYTVEVCVIDNDGDAGCDTFVVNLVDVGINKENGTNAVRPGQTFTYTLQIDNVGTISATGVTVTDTLPIFTTFQGSTGGGSYDGLNHTVIWNVGTLLAGDATTRTVTVQASSMPPTYINVITNTVVIGQDGRNGPDLKPNNNRSTDADQLLSVTANAGGPYNGDEGVPIVLDASATSDRNGVIVLYEWDLDNDGDFDDASSTMPTTTVTFPNSGQLIVRLRATDNSGESDMAVTTANIANVAPSVVTVTLPILTEGDTVNQIIATFTDLGVTDVHTATINWGDGSVTPALLNEANGSGTLFATHTYLDDGLFNLNICVGDQEGAVGCAAQTVTVINSLPFIDDTSLTDLRLWSHDELLSCYDPLPHWQVSPDGATVTQTLNSRPTVFVSNFSSFDTRVEANVNVFSQTVTNAIPFIDDDYIGFVLGYAPNDLNNSDADYLLIDWKGGRNPQSHHFGCGGFTTAQPGLSVSRVSGSPADSEMWGHTDYTVCNGSDNSVTELARATNLGNRGWQHNNNYQLAFDLSANQLQVFVDGVLEIDIVGDFADLANGRFGLYTYSQHNVVFTGLNFQSITVDEGVPLNLSSDFSDLGVLDTHIATVDWGDGNVVTATVMEAGGSGSVEASHIYPDGDAAYVLDLCISDDDGGTKCSQIDVNVNNVAPTVDAGPDIDARGGDTVNLVAPFTDPGTLDTHTATINWGDGTIVTATITETNGSGTVLATHVYAADGVYFAEVCVTDKDGAVGCDSFQVNSVDLKASKDDGTIIAIPGNILTYTIVIENSGSLTTTNVNVGDILPDYTHFLTTTADGVYNASAHLVLWQLPSLGAGQTVTRTVSVMVDSLIPATVQTITNTVIASDDGTQGLDQTPADNIATDVNFIPDPPLAAFSVSKELNVAQLEDGAAIVSVSSELNGSFEAEDAIDANNGTAWRTATGEIVSQTLVVALTGNRAHVIDSVTLLAGTANNAPQKFAIGVSTDSTTNFTLVTTGTMTQSGSPQTFHFAPVQARYVQLFINDNHGAADVIELIGFEAHTRERQGGVRTLLEGTAAIATVTNETASNPATNAIDFSTSSFWDTGTNNVVAQALTVDLVGDDHLLIDRIRLQSTTDDTAVQDFQVRVSTSGLADADFETIFFGTLPQDGLVHWYTFPAVPAKYVRFVPVNNYGSLTGIRVHDFQAFSTQSGGATVPFDDFSRGTDSQIAAWAWTFGDGATSSAQHPLHTYGDAGTYTITLTITDSFGLTDSSSLTYTVLPPPTVVFTWTPTIPEENTAVAFTDLSFAAPGSVLLDRTWQFTDPNAQSSSSTPSHTFLDDGPRPVRLTVVNSELVTATLVQTVTVKNITPTVSLAPDSLIRRTGETLSIPSGSETSRTFGDQSPTDLANLAFTWDLGDGRIITNVNSLSNITYAVPGTYTLTFTATDPQGASDNDSMVVRVFDDHIAPTPVIELVGSRNVALLESQNIPTLLGAGARIIEYSGRFNSTSFNVTNLIDLSPETDWATTNGSNSDQFVTILLAGNRIHNIDRVQLRGRTDCCAGQRPQAFEVWVSTTTAEPDAFTKVLAATATNNSNLQTFTFPDGPVDALFVKYIMLNNYGDNCCITTAQFHAVSTALAEPGGVVSVSSELDTEHRGEMALDPNSNRTYWQTLGNSDEQLTILLAGGEVQPINGVSLYPLTNNGRGVQDFVIEASTTTTDSLAFTALYTGTAANSTQLQHFIFPQDVNAKYVRLRLLNNYGGSRIALYQFQVRGTVPRESDNWFNSAVAVRLAGDENVGGSGVNFIEYSTNFGTGWSVYNAPFLFTNHGSTPFSARARDVARNISDPVHTFIPLDETPKFSSQQTGQQGSDWLTPAVRNKSLSLNCVACHVQGDTLHGLALGSATGFNVDTDHVDGIGWLADFMTSPPYLNTSNWLWGHPPGGSSHRTINSSHSLFGLAMYDRFVSTDHTTELLLGVDAMIARQQANGRWIIDHNNAPTNIGDIEPTVHMIYPLNQAIERVDATTAATYQASLDSAVAWLRTATPSSVHNQDKALKVLGLIEAGVPPDDPVIVDLVNTILADQFVDGGWAERTNYTWTSTFASGQALYALCVAGVSRTNPQVIQGIDWLIHQQVGFSPGSLTTFGGLDGPWPLRYTAADVQFTSTMWPVIALGCFGDLDFELDAQPETQVVSANLPISQTTTFTVTLLNSGVTTDTYDLSLLGGLPGWSATLNKTAVTVGVEQTAQLTLTVTTPISLPEGLTVLYGVTAQSQTNPDIIRSTIVEVVTTPPPTAGHNTSTTIVDGDGVTTHINVPTRLAATVQDTTDSVAVVGPNTGVVNFLVAGLPVGSDDDADGDGIFEIVWTPDATWPSIGVQDLRAIYSGIDRPDPGIDLLPSFDAGSLSVEDAVDLVISKDDGVTVARRGDVLTYTVALTNQGTLSAFGVVVTDTLPAHTTLISVTGTTSITGSIINWSLPLLAPADSVAYDVVVQVNALIPPSVTDITNTVTAQDNGTNGPDSVPANNIAIDANAVPLNRLPEAVDDFVTMAEDSTTVIDVLANDNDLDDDPLTIVAFTQPVTGVLRLQAGVSPTLVYTPAINFNGTVTFTYTIDDNVAGTDTAVVTVTVTPVNDPPVAVDDLLSIPEDTIGLFDLLANDYDIDGDVLTIVDLAQPATGTAVLGTTPTQTVTYTPPPNFNGVVGFTYIISDAFDVLDTATVTVTVTPVNDPPVVNDDAAVIAPNTVVTLTVLANDSDIDGDLLTVMGITSPFTGTAVLNGDGSVTYTPPVSFTGFVTFTYTMSDAAGVTDTALIEILVADVMQVNFQRPESDTPLGYLPDGGHAYGLRDNGLIYGWIDPLTGLPADNTVNARDRDWFNIPPDQRYDTFNHMQTYGAFIWETAVPDGWYLVYVVAGDPEYRNGIYRLDVEGVLTVDGQPNKGQYWIAGTSVVAVTDGRLTIGNNPAATGNNKLAFVHITPLGQTPLGGFSANINFQPSDVTIPTGYEGDFGNLFGERGNTMIYGWDIDVTDRARDRDINDVSLDQRYDTLIQMQFGPTATWEIELPNGIYMVRLVNGDSRYFIDHTYETSVEGLLVSGGDAVPVNRLRAVESSLIVAVNDGRLTIGSGPNAERNKVQFIEIQQIGR